ncbi:MAG: chemotaxis protein CheW [Pseudomonadota bacterium]|nr:chemotaxis protein CheW [Pseudomonadota bacterium]
MSESPTDKASQAAGIDLSQFFQIFFEEAGENLETMEQRLLNLDIEHADDEELNAIFRCAHSVKGGAATFGFADVAELTHQMETLLDKLRRHELQPSAPMVDVLLAAGDALKAQLARHQGNGADPIDTQALLASIRALLAGEGALATAPKAVAAPPATPPAAPASEAATPTTPVRALELTVGPLQNLALADSLVELFSEIPGLGSIEPLDAGREADGMRRFKVLTASSDNDLFDLFGFHVAREQVRLAPLNSGYGFHEGAPGAPPAAAAAEAGYGFFDNAPGLPHGAETSAAAAAASSTPAPSGTSAPSAPKAARTDKAPNKSAGTPESSTLRVSVEKVDQLINLVGELVITQAMLAQNSKGEQGALNQQMAAVLADLERNTRDLQEAVMSIRMIPMSLVFNRFPRMLRDLAGKLGKKVEMLQVGEATELDKGLVEKITDPLTHLVRNSCDHGIEMPADRVAKGKPEQGSITLIASHQGGSIVIEVRDDGRGLNRGKLLQKARERGIEAPDSMPDSEVYGLIFAPGFSTADVVTDVSGRGVGMDVVKKNITALGGTVEIDSAEGYGMTVRVRLPLTLAIMDGMSVAVGDECYILPLASVVESFQIRPGMVRSIGGSGRVVEVRDEFMPVLDLQQVFGVPAPLLPDAANDNSIMVVAEAEGGRVALLVNQLLGQQQVVVKNLESNYRRVDDVSGATILGDGRVALILDVGSLVRRSRH